MNELPQPTDPIGLLGQSLELPCGSLLKNRIVKSAMSDSLGDGAGKPTDAQIRLYERWAEGGTALSIIGEVQGDPRFPEKPGNLVIGPNSDLRTLRVLAETASIQGAQIWPQLGHAGALTHLPIGLAKGPSALHLPGLQCEGMSGEEVEKLPALFARTARLAKAAGFGGVQLHAGHGFLLSQFLSPLFNQRKDRYGGSVEARSQIILEIIAVMRQAVGSTFPIGIKINSTDKLEGGLTEGDALELVRLLDRTSIDLIDVSGGTYFPGAKASSDGASESGPYFVEFAMQAKGLTRVPIMLTGGFKRRKDAVGALAKGAADLVGLARAMVLEPRLPEIWLSDAGGDPTFPVFQSPPSGGMTAWYTMRIKALGEDSEDGSKFDPQTALQVYEERDAARCPLWLKAFPVEP